jgi:hypothetical protein
VRNERNVCVVRAWLLCNILISGKVIKELPAFVGSGTGGIPYRMFYQWLSTIVFVLLMMSTESTRNM